jgi:polar amino acid transport system permease protein
VFRAGIESVQPVAARGGPLARPDLRADECGTWYCPRRCAGSRRPILNDLVALQKDVGLISLAGPVDAIRAAQIQHGRRRTTSPRTSSPGVLFVLLAIPLIAVTDWVTLRAARRQSADGTRERET